MAVRSGTIGTHKTTVEHFDNGNVAVTYHSTRIFHYVPRLKKVCLKTGGWFTPTTKRRMNQALDTYQTGLRVFQKDFDWFVESKNGTVPFRDGMVINV